VQDPTDIVSYVDGFSLQKATYVNVSKCIEDSLTIVRILNMSFQEIAQGLIHDNCTEIRNGIRDLGLGVNEIGVVYKECIEDEYLSNDIQWWGLFISKSRCMCGLPKKDFEKRLVWDLQQAVRAWKAGNYRAAGTFTRLVFNILKWDL